jgi:hypothetical protein
MNRLFLSITLAATAVLAGRAATAADAPPAAAASDCGRADGIEAGPRQAVLLEARRAKCARLAPYKAGFLERQILAFEKAERPPIDRINLFGFYPRVAVIDHRSQWALGTRLWHPDIGRSRLDLTGSAFWSLQGFQYYDLQAGRLPHRGRSFPLYARKSDDVFELAKVRADDDERLALYGSFSLRPLPRGGRAGRGRNPAAGGGRVRARRDPRLRHGAGLPALRARGHLRRARRGREPPPRGPARAAVGPLRRP